MIHAFMAVLVLLALAYGILTGATQAALESVIGSNGGDDVRPENVNVSGTSEIIPTDPHTWPSGDRIWDCCRAIAFTEGYNALVNGQPSNPARLNNPGDISDGSSVYGSEFHSGSSITKFPDAATGWAWLYAKIKNAVTGVSHVYKADMSWREIGAKWAPPSANVWANNVATTLGVSPDSTLGDYVNG